MEIASLTLLMAALGLMSVAPLLFVLAVTRAFRDDPEWPWRLLRVVVIASFTLLTLSAIAACVALLSGNGRGDEGSTARAHRSVVVAKA